MRIAICDDEARIRKEFHERINAYFLENNSNCEIVEFSRGDEFLAVHDEYDLVFMDCVLEGESGLDVIAEVRKVNEKLMVVFLTSFSEHAIESIRLDPFRYLVKPVSDEELTETLDSFLHIYRRTRKLVVPVNDQIYFIDADEVMYIEADKKHTVVRTVKEQYLSTKGITEFDSEINNSHFFRTHRSFILNMKYVSSIEKKTIILKNGEKVICSAKNYDEFLKNYMSYLKYES